MALWNKDSGNMTQNEMILEHMRLYGGITSMDAFRSYQITRLSGRIHELRQQGYKITTHKEKARNGALYAVYRLDKGDGNGK